MPSGTTPPDRMVSLARRLRICIGQTNGPKCALEFSSILNTKPTKPLMNWLKLPQATSHVCQIFCCPAVLGFLAQIHRKGRSGQETRVVSTTDRKCPPQQQVDFFFLLFLPWGSGTQRLHWEWPCVCWCKKIRLGCTLEITTTSSHQNHQIRGSECSESVAIDAALAKESAAVITGHH